MRLTEALRLQDAVGARVQVRVGVRVGEADALGLGEKLGSETVRE